MKSKLTKEQCRTLAQNFTTRREFCTEHPDAYKVAQHNGWLNDYNWLERSQLTYKYCRDIAIKCKTRHEFITMSKRAYAKAYRAGWLNDWKWLDVPKKASLKLTFAQCKREAKKYLSARAFRSGSPEIYSFACRSNWLHKFTWLDMRTLEEECADEARRYTTREDFKAHSRKAYNLATKKGWIKDYTWLVEPPKNENDHHAPFYSYWTKENCFKNAKRFTTLRDFREQSSSAYQIAAKNNWLGDYYWMASERKAYLTYNRCYKEAKLYNTMEDFMKGSPSEYKKSLKQDWLREYHWLNATATPAESEGKPDNAQCASVPSVVAPIRKTPKKHKEKAFAGGNKLTRIYQYGIDGKFVAKYKSIDDACEAVGGGKTGIITSCLKGNCRTAYGYIWKWMEDNGCDE